MINYEKKNIKKILVIKNDKIGDMALSANIFRELRKNFPKAKISVVVSKSNKALVEKNKNIDELLVLDYPSSLFDKKLIDYVRFSKNLRKERFDLGIDLRGSIFNILLLMWLGKVKHKIGFYNRFFSKFFLDYAYKKDRYDKHVSFQRIDLINKALGLDSKDYWPEIVTDSNDVKELSGFVKKNKLKNYVSLVPVASFGKKQLSFSKWDKIIKHIQKKYNKKVVLVGGPGDKDKIDFLVKKNPKCVSVTDKNLRVVYLLLKKSDLVVAPDGGPMHLAWIGKVKLLALIPGFLHVNYIKPLGKNSRMLVSDKRHIDSISIESILKEIDLSLK